MDNGVAMAAGEKPMTKGRLKQYRAIKVEIKELHRKLKGCDEMDSAQEEEKHKKRLEILEGECREIEGFIENIQGSRERQAFEMKFYEGKTQQEIGKKLYMDQSAVSRVIDSVLKDA